MNVRFAKYIAAALLAASAAAPASAVTDKEMDEARAITAKAYLRYANNGSGYLDEVNAKSMSELTPRLKAKEKENLKDFNSVKVPGDYASWDKEKLVEFWSVTFFTSPALSDQGKAAKTIVRKRISNMKIAAPAKPEAPAPAAAETPSAAEPTPAPAADTAAPQAAMPTAAEAAETQQDILQDQKAIEQDAAEADRTPEEQSHTWVYVLVLAILVAVVIWLVVYAANLMKRQPQGDDDTSDDASDEIRAKARKTIEAKNREIEDLHRRLEAEENRSADLGMELEKLKLERSRFEDKIAQLREENTRLAREAQEMESAAATAATATRVRPEAPRRAPEPERRPAPEQPRAEQPAADSPRPARRAPEPEKPAAPVIRVIYLGRANARGIFVRADRRINAGNTIYRLDTNDGLVGTFHVVDEPEVVDVALSDPAIYLGNGCICDDIEDVAGVTRIATESAGTAIFENGYWKVLRKTRIRYE